MHEGLFSNTGFYLGVLYHMVFSFLPLSLATRPTSTQLSKCVVPLTLYCDYKNNIDKQKHALHD